MIIFVTTRAGRHTLDDYLAGVAADLRTLITVWTYPTLFDRVAYADMPSATVVFTDIERLDWSTRERATYVCEALLAEPDRWRVLNHPRRTLRRLALLERLYAEGINDFRAWKVNEAPPSDVRFPVFLRIADDHDGARSDLIHDRETLAEAVCGRDDRWIVCEYRPHLEDEIFIKYGAFIVAGQVTPRHVMFAAQWVVKSNTIINAHTMHASWVYLKTNPHAEQIARIAALANVDYGRIDHVELPDGRLRVWEINTNPHLCQLGTFAESPRRALHLAAHTLLREAFRAIDLGPAIPPGLPDRIRWRALQAGMPTLFLRLPIERYLWRWIYARAVSG